MSEGKKAKRMHPRKSDANFLTPDPNRRGEYGRTGRYSPDGKPQSPGRKAGRFSELDRDRLRIAD